MYDYCEASGRYCVSGWPLEPHFMTHWNNWAHFGIMHLDGCLISRKTNIIKDGAAWSRSLIACVCVCLVSFRLVCCFFVVVFIASKSLVFKSQYWRRNSFEQICSGYFERNQEWQWLGIMTQENELNYVFVCWFLCFFRPNYIIDRGFVKSCPWFLCSSMIFIIKNFVLKRTRVYEEFWIWFT